MRYLRFFWFFCLVLPQTLSAQGFTFELEITPSFRKTLNLKIEAVENEGRLTMSFGANSDTTTQTVCTSKTKKLIEFLQTYDFPHRTSSIKIPDSVYYNTISLPSENLIIIGNDTLLDDFSGLYIKGHLFKTEAGAFRSKELLFDSIRQQYYRNVNIVSFWVDGTYFSGVFNSEGFSKSFEIYSARFTQSDVELLKLILDMITDKDSDFFWHFEKSINEVSLYHEDE